MTQAPAGSFWSEVRDAVSRRAAVMVLGVLAIQLGFIASYLAAFHHPTPHRIPLGVVAPAGAAGQVAARLNALPGDPLDARCPARCGDRSGTAASTPR